MAACVAFFFPHLDQIVFTDRKRSVPLFSSLTATVICWTWFSLGQFRRQLVFCISSLIFVCLRVHARAGACVCMCVQVCVQGQLSGLWLVEHSLNTEQNSKVSNITKNWPTLSSLVADTWYKRVVRCPPPNTLLGFTAKKHKGLETTPPLSTHPCTPHGHAKAFPGPIWCPVLQAWTFSLVALYASTQRTQLGGHPDLLNLRVGPDRWLLCTRAF